jgi:hypothetical protein
MDSLDYWRLCDELSVVQAALLIVGKDPSEIQDAIDSQPPADIPVGYSAAKSALINAIRRKQLRANIVRQGDVRGSEDFPTGPDWYYTTVNVDELKLWLSSRGVGSGFFFPVAKRGPDYLLTDHPSYSPKLAAATYAWMAISADSELRRGKSVKQALAAWLRQHANEFGLTKEDGNPNEQGIEEVAKIAN